MSSLGSLARAATWAPLDGNSTPGQTEGPFYFDDRLIRPNIGEGLAGLPLRLDLRLLDSAGLPVSDARIALWHASPAGIYSGYAPNPFQSEETRGRNYCRGVQLTNAHGDVSFETVYPGWYVVRTTHVHVKVIVNGVEVLTTQLYFPDTVNDDVFGIVEPYARRGNRNIRNSNDGLYKKKLECTVQSHPGAYTASYTICL